MKKRKAVTRVNKFSHAKNKVGKMKKTKKV